MKQYPPSEDEVLEAFRCWLNANRTASYVVASRPDKTERTAPAIDFILQDPTSCHEIAVEVSSLWRSGEAGSEDAYWNNWQGRVCELLAAHVPGLFFVATPLQVPEGVSPETFAAALKSLILRDINEIIRRVPDSQWYECNLCGMDILISQAAVSPHGVSFARRGSPAMLETLPDFLRRVLNKKSPKLKQHKQAGRETWLVVYNTVWPVMSPRDVRVTVAAALGPADVHIDHVGIIAMNPPSDATVNVVR